MSIRPNPDGSVDVRWREAGRGSRERQRRFYPPRTKGAPTALRQATAFQDEIRRRKQLGGIVDLERGTLTMNDLVMDYWRLHAVPNLAESTRDSYGSVWQNHLRPRLGDRRVIDITPSVVVRLADDLDRTGVGSATRRRALAVLQSMMRFAIVERHIDHNPVAAVTKPAYQRERHPTFFAPLDVEQIRAHLAPVSAALVSILAYAGPRPEEALRLTWGDVGERTLRFVDTKRGGRQGRERFTPLLAPLAQDLRHWRFQLGRPAAGSPVIPTNAGDHWAETTWRNWRKRTWQQGWHDEARGVEPEKRKAIITPVGSRPRDLRGSYVTLLAHEGTPLTTIAQNCGTSVAMLDRHYARIWAEWDGIRRPAEDVINDARQAGEALRSSS